MGREMGSGFQKAFSRRNPQKCKLYGTWQGLSPKVPHNHWGKGNDGAWGVFGVDDDSNGMIDDAAVIPLFEPGSGDDSCKNRNYANGYNNWPNSWTLPADQKYQLLTPIEAEAVEATDRSMNENDHARQDWGCPGKNHSTVNVWNN